jgi:hypothetical protein
MLLQLSRSPVLANSALLLAKVGPFRLEGTAVARAAASLLALRHSHVMRLYMLQRRCGIYASATIRYMSARETIRTAATRGASGTTEAGNLSAATATAASEAASASSSSAGDAVAAAAVAVAAVAGLEVLVPRSLSLCDTASNPESPAAVEIEEPVSKSMFPLALSETELLVAAGVRLMTPMKVQVYSIGLYVDPVAANVALAPWVDRSASQILGDTSFWTTLTSPAETMHRTFRLQVLREVAGKHMQHGQVSLRATPSLSRRSVNSTCVSNMFAPIISFVLFLNGSQL